MINDKKLICAFIYSGYESGYCGLLLKPKEKEKHMKLYKDFIQNKVGFPKETIENTQSKMVRLTQENGVRDYIYSGHLDIVKKRIEKEREKEFSLAINNPMVLFAAISCPVNFYKVVESDNNYNSIVGENLFLKTRKNLEILSGGDIPKVGDIVSGHWNYMLEVITDWKNLEDYKNKFKNYFSILKPALINND